MKRSSQIDISIEEMNDAVQDLQENLKSLSCFLIEPKALEATVENENKEAILTVPLVEVLPLVSFASLLIEIAGRIEGLVKAVEELANLAEFKPKQNQLENK